MSSPSDWKAALPFPELGKAALERGWNTWFGPANFEMPIRHPVEMVRRQLTFRERH